MSNEEARTAALEEALSRWAADRLSLAETRDPLVRKAHEAGISKHRIHVLSGVARSTIDEILGSGTTGKKTAMPWIVNHREGWCALPPGAEPDPDACNDPTLCGYVVTLRGGSKHGLPDCPECLALMAGEEK